MKRILVALATLPIIIAAGCGPTNAGGPTTGAAPASSSTSAAKTVSSSHALKAQNISLTVLPGGRIGGDGKMHDTFAPANFTVLQGVPVTLTVYNYDSGQHTVTNGDLQLNLDAKGSTKNGVPGVTSVTFTPAKTGDFTWQCLMSCDSENQDWSMTHTGYMMGTIHVVPNDTNQQFVYLTIKDGLQFASADGKLHDSYSPAAFTVQAGIPVTVQVENFDTGKHSFTSGTLGVNEIFPGATKEGQPSVTTFTFTPSKAGSFTWMCIEACDGGPTGWAMSHSGYMMGTVTVNP